MSSLIVNVVKIDKVETHPNADKLDIAFVKGWQVIVGRNEYKAGDKVIYVPPDTIVPQSLIEKYNLAFLSKDGRLKTIKLRKVLSEGLILPAENHLKEGDSVVELYGFKKWEEPVSNRGLGNTQQQKKRVGNLNFDKYTDIENIKNYPNEFTKYDYVVVTEKIHGTNFRCGRLLKTSHNKILNFFYKLFKIYEFVYGSHNVQLKFDLTKKNVYQDIVVKYNLDKIVDCDTIIYGEIYGKGIQDLTYNLTDIDLRVFDIKHNGKYLDYNKLEALCRTYQLTLVPFLYMGDFDLEKVKSLSTGNSVLADNQMKEGCVVRSYYEEKTLTLGRKILKVINVDYLTRKNGTEHK